MAGWRSMSSSVEMVGRAFPGDLVGSCKGPGGPARALRCGGRASPDCPAVLGLAAHRVTHCAPCGRSVRTDAVSQITRRAARAGCKSCAPRRRAGAPGPAPLSLCSSVACPVGVAHQKRSMAVGASGARRFLGRREAQVDGRRAQRASTSDSSRLSERRARRARSELRDATVGRASQRSRAQPDRHSMSRASLAPTAMRAIACTHRERARQLAKPTENQRTDTP